MVGEQILYILVVEVLSFSSLTYFFPNYTYQIIHSLNCHF